MPRFKLVIISQIALFISLFLTWTSLSNVLLNNSINNLTFYLTFHITLLSAVCIYITLCSFRKFGTSRDKKIGVICGFLLIYFIGIYAVYSTFYYSANKYIYINGNLNRFYLTISPITNLFLLLQITFTTLLLILDFFFLFYYCKTMSNCSKDIIKGYIKNYRGLTRIKEIKSINRYIITSLLLFSISTTNIFDILLIHNDVNRVEAINFYNNTRFLVDTILVSVIFIILLFSIPNKQNHIYYRTSENHNCFYLIFYLQLTNFSLVILLSILYYYFNYIVIALLLIISPLVYTVFSLILLEKINCYYINKVNNIKEKESQV